MPTVSNLTYKSSIDGTTITVRIYANGTLIGEKTFSTVTFTIESAEASIDSEFNAFGLYINGGLYQKPQELPDTEPSTPDGVSSTSNEAAIKDINKKNIEETDLEATSPKNIEETDKVSDESKKEISETTESNDEATKESKPKLIIKIPLPFGKGYITIDLGGLLGKLLAGLAAALAALILAKIADMLFDLIADKLGNGEELTSGAVDGMVNNIDVDKVISESKTEYNSSLGVSDDLSGLTSLSLTTDEASDTVSDEYTKANKIKSKRNKSQYSIDKRNRTDILDSETVKDRNTSKNKNQRVTNNPNYGIYID